MKTFKKVGPVVLCSGLALAGVSAASAADLVYDVAEGETEYVTTDINADTANVDAFVKKGPGTLVISNQVGVTRNFKWATVEAGTLVLAKGNDSFRPRDVTVKADATLRLAVSGPFVNAAVLHVEKDGLVHFGSCTDTVDGFTGEGTIQMASKAGYTVTFSRGPHRFGGRVLGNPIIEASNSSGDPNQVMVLCASNSFANARFRPGNGSKAGFTNLLFAAGIGKFYLNGFDFAFNRVLMTDDEEGNPITVRSPIYNYGGTAGGLAGSGSYVVPDRNDTATLGENWTAFTGDLTLLGATKISSPSVPFGQIRWINASSTCRLVLNTSSKPMTVDCPVYGNYIIDFYNPVHMKHLHKSAGQLYVYDTLTVSGDDSAITSYHGIMWKAWSPAKASTLVVTNGAVIGSSWSTSTTRGGKLKYHTGISTGGDSDSQNLLSTITVTGRDSAYYASGLLAHRINALDGGALVIAGNSPPPGGCTAADPAVLTVDGGIVRMSGTAALYGYYPFSDSDAFAVQVGAKGATFDLEQGAPVFVDGYHVITLKRPIASGVAEGADGGVTRIGAAHLVPTYPWTITGPFRNRDGSLDLNEYAALTGATVPLFGTGDFELESSNLRLYMTTATTLRIGTGTGAKFRYGGGASVILRCSSSYPAQTLELGPLARRPGGALFLASTVVDGGFDPAKAGTVRTSAGTALSANGRLLAPVFWNVSNSTDSQENSRRIGFLTYDATNDRFTGYAGASTTLSAGAVCDLAADETAPEGTTSVEALRLVNRTLTIPEGATVKVGDGVNPGCVLLNTASWSGSSVAGPGTLDFGTSEGLFVAGRRTTHGIGAKIAGSNGVTFVAPIEASYNRVSLGRSNAYTGGTRIAAVGVVPCDDGAFGTGVVRCQAGDIGGGCVWFEGASRTLANDFEIAGCGYMRDSSDNGAIFANTGTHRLTGRVTVTESARVRANSGASLAFDGVVSGDRLSVFGAGKTILTAANVYTGGTYVASSATLRLEGAGSVGTGAVLLDGGTLEFTGRAAQSFTNDLDGVGTVLVADRGGDVTFGGTLAKRADAKLTLALGGRRATVNSLAGFATVTNFCASGTTLCVTDGGAFAGTVAPGVTIVSSFSRAGAAVILR